MATQVEKGLYNGTDQRYNMFEIDSCVDASLAARIRQQAKSVACLVDKRNLSPLGQGHTISTRVRTLSTKFAQAAPLEEGTAFENELVLGEGTAFLIGKQTALTAGHCVCSDTGVLNPVKVQQLWLVFGFEMKKLNKVRKKFQEDDVYRIENVIAYRYTKSTATTNDDWAILRLTREVQGRAPLDITICDHIPKQKRVYMLGHPSGLPLKLATNAEVEESSDGKNYFQASLDAFGGNSGSPIFLEDSRIVAGMLFKGSTDFVRVADHKGSGANRTIIAHVSPEQIRKDGWEKCQKITSLSFLRSILSSIDIPPPLGGMETLKARLKPGLSVEAACPCAQPGIVVVARGFSAYFNMSQICATTICSSCNQSVHPDNVNTMILSSCQYSVEGQNTKDQTISEKAMKLLAGLDRVVRFDVRDWCWLELTVEQLS